MLTILKNKPALGILLYLLLKRNLVIQPMDPLQSGIPLPSLLLKEWPLIVIDLKDCFLIIPLQEKGQKKLPRQCLHIIILSSLEDTSTLSFYR